MIPTEAAIAALQQHDQLFHRQMQQLRQQQASQQQLLQQQYNLQRQLLLENQDKQLKSHLLDYLDQHKRMEGVIAMSSGIPGQEAVSGKRPQDAKNVDNNNKKTDVKQRLQARKYHNFSNNSCATFRFAAVIWDGRLIIRRFVGFPE